MSDHLALVGGSTGGGLAEQLGSVQSNVGSLQPGGRAVALPIEWAADIQPHLSSYWLIRDVLPQQGLALIYGHPGCGKSFLAVDIGMHVAQGRDWAGHTTQQGLVVYVAAEGQRGLRNRVVAFRQFHEIDGDPSFALIPSTVNLFDSPIDYAALAATVCQASDKCGESPALIVIDTISKTLGSGRENTDDLAVYVANCGRLSSEFKCCVLAVHHRPKNAEGSDPRGHGSLLAGVDTAMIVKSSQTRMMQIQKQKDGEEGETFTFDLSTVDLGIDDNGAMVRSCVVTSTGASHGLPKQPRSHPNRAPLAGTQVVFELLLDVLRQKGREIPDVISDDQIDRSKVTLVVEKKLWRSAVIDDQVTLGKIDRNSRKQKYQRGRLRLEKDGLTKSSGNWVWLTDERYLWSGDMKVTLGEAR